MLLAMQAWKAPYFKRYDAKKTSLFPKTKLGTVYFRLHANNDPEMYTLSRHCELFQ